MGLKRPSSKVENKVAKKPAAKVTKVAKFKKPAAQTGKKGILKGKQKEVEKDNGEEGEEEEMLTDDEVVHTVTSKNLKTHQQLLDAKLCSAKEIDKALAKLPANEVQSLWKKFEKNRQMAGAESSYKEATKGTGSQERKHKLLRSFILDGGSIAKNYKEAMLVYEKTDEKGGMVKFNTWKQQVDKYGKAEAMSRLKAGTMKFRKSPTDPRFFEFADESEYVKWKAKKSQTVAYKTDKHKAGKDDWLSMENLNLEDVGDASFALAGNQLDDMEIEPELKDFFNKQLSVKDDEDKDTKKQKEKEEAKEKKNKWEEMSTVSKDDNKSTLLKKLLAFKAELCKDERALQEAKLDMKGKAGCKDELKILSPALTEVQACQKKIEKAINSGSKKEESKKALLESLAALEKSKKCKKLVAGPPKKKAKKEEEEED